MSGVRKETERIKSNSALLAIETSRSKRGNPLRRCARRPADHRFGRQSQYTGPVSQTGLGEMRFVALSRSTTSGTTVSSAERSSFRQAQLYQYSGNGFGKAGLKEMLANRPSAPLAASSWTTRAVTARHRAAPGARLGAPPSPWPPKRRQTG